jgi:hypothetical protein
MMVGICFSENLRSSCSLLHMDHPFQAHNQYGYFTFVSDCDKRLLQALQQNIPRNHSTQCSINIQCKIRNFVPKMHQHRYMKSLRRFLTIKMQKIRQLSPAAHDYFVGDKGIEASKWRSTQWLWNTTLPPRYGIVSMNVLESSNSMYEEARKLPWLYCLDNILNSMSSRISTLRALNKNKTGVVPEWYEKLDNRWTTCAGYIKFLKLRKVLINTRLHIQWITVIRQTMSIK